MNKIVFFPVLFFLISCNGNKKDNQVKTPERSFIRYECVNESIESICDVHSVWESVKNTHKSFSVISVFDNGDREEVSDGLDVTNEEAAARSVASKVAFFSHFSRICNYSLTIEEGVELTRQHPEFFFIDPEDKSTAAGKINVIYDSIPGLFRLLDENYYQFPLDEEGDLLRKYLNGVYEESSVDLEYGAVTSEGSDFRTWTFMESGTSRGYSVKILWRDGMVAFKFVGRRLYE